MNEHTPFSNLEREEADIVNPMSKVSSEVTTDLDKTISAMTASKVSNMCSRLGGVQIRTANGT